jgi:hypothetical protein
MAMIWIMRHPQATPDMLGLIPEMFSNSNPLSAKEQININYSHGGGFRAFNGFKMLEHGLKFHGDPLMPLIAETVLHPDTDKAETIRFYLSSWVAIVQLDGSYEICRMD